MTGPETGHDPWLLPVAIVAAVVAGAMLHRAVSRGYAPGRLSLSLVMVTGLGLVLLGGMDLLPGRSFVLTLGAALATLAVVAPWARQERAGQRGGLSLPVLRAVVEEIPINLSLKGVDGQYLFVNRKMREWYGLDEDSFLGSDIRGVGGEPEDATAVLVDLDSKILQTGEAIEGAIVRGHPDDGQLRRLIISKTPIHDGSGAIVAILTGAVDDTQRWKAEAELARNAQQIRRTLDSLSVAVSVKDLEGRYLVVNNVYREWYGLEEAGLIGSNPDRLLNETPEHAQRRRAHEAEVLANDEMVAREDSLVDAGGSTRLVQLVKTPYRDARDQLVGVCTTVTDISARVAAERELARHRDRLEEMVSERAAALRSAQDELLASERLATIGRLTGTVGHELRNPLGVISVSLETLRAKEAEALARHPAILERIQRSSTRCTRIIDELMEYARKGPVHHHTIELDEWVREVVAELVVPRTTQLQLDLRAGCVVPLDRDLMRLTLLSLLRNALQALERVDDVHGRRLRVDTSSSEQYVTIAVSDTGPGIHEDLHARIFEPLFSTRGFGIGFGLPLARRMVEQHGGELALSSSPGAGATFTITLPRRSPGGGSVPVAAKG